MENKIATIKLLLARHGETEENAKRIICGQQPGVLTEMGKRQAKQIGAFLKRQSFRFDQIYVSDLGRTVDTFQNIKSQAEYLQQIPTIFTSLIREKNGGLLAGQPSATWRQMAEKQNKDIRQFRSEKGESWQDVNARCSAFLKLIVGEHIINNKNLSLQNSFNIFAVCHGGIIMEFKNVMNTIMEKRKPVHDDSAKNCSIHQFLIEYPIESQEFRVQEAKIKCIRQNFVDHLNTSL